MIARTVLFFWIISQKKGGVEVRVYIEKFPVTIKLEISMRT